MNKIIFDLLSPTNCSDYIQAGIVGLKIALESLPPSQKTFDWGIDGSKLTVAWDGNFAEDWQWLATQTYLAKDGLISFPGSTVFDHVGFINCLLTVPATRTATEVIEVNCPSKFGDVSIKTLGISKYMHQRFISKITKPNGDPKKAIELTSWLHPNATGGIEARLDNALAALFSPLTWGFYEIREELKGGKTKYSRALVCPVVPQFDFVPQRPQSYEDFICASLEDAVLKYSLANQCHSHGYQFYSERANRPARIISSCRVSAELGADYQEFIDKFPNGGGLSINNVPVVFANAVRGKIAKNLTTGQQWYSNLVQLDFQELSYNKEGLGGMFNGDRHQRWKEKTGFEQRDHRRGYKAGHAAATRGRQLSESLPDNDWGKGYREGWQAAKNISEKA